MLGKLIKHEFIATWKNILLIDLITVIVGILASLVGFAIVGNIDDLPVVLQMFLFFGALGFAFLMLSAYLLTMVCNVVRYYRSLYTAEGYLTFTLPATTTQILTSKVLVAVIWQILTTICIAFSVTLLVWNLLFWSAVNEGRDMSLILQSFSENFSAAFGGANFFVLLLYLIKGVMQIILSLMLFFFAISIGQLSAKHKVAGAVAAYFCIRIIYGFISFGINIMTGTFSMLFSFGIDPGNYFLRASNTALVISIVAVILMFIANIYITNNKLNLD
ncbi:hypothetical protein [Butyrivibrio sp. JL13D10]|uniref:hypothetical protein n=1 Tax=Butyrivibrio sp. JL13D10 TaxID=3236815 RepID=UPI0038B625DF